MASICLDVPGRRAHTVHLVKKELIMSERKILVCCYDDLQNPAALKPIEAMLRANPDKSLPLYVTLVPLPTTISWSKDPDELDRQLFHLREQSVIHCAMLLSSHSQSFSCVDVSLHSWALKKPEQHGGAVLSYIVTALSVAEVIKAYEAFLITLSADDLQLGSRWRDELADIQFAPVHTGLGNVSISQAWTLQHTVSPGATAFVTFTLSGSGSNEADAREAYREVVTSYRKGSLGNGLGA
jgi:hypothetical protein